MQRLKPYVHVFTSVLGLGVLVQLGFAGFHLVTSSSHAEVGSVKGVSTLTSEDPIATPIAFPAYTVQKGKVLEGDLPLTIKGINWFGFDTNDHVPHGLWERNWEDMLMQMKELGFNAVRLPVCSSTLNGVKVNSIDYRFNTDLEGLNSAEVLDRFADGMARHGLYFVIDFHSFDCVTYDALWYTPTHTEEEWIQHLTSLAIRYANNPYFLGLDLKNEPHNEATWGTGNSATDWNLAAERAGKAVLEVNPRILIFVQGVHTNPTCVSVEGSWWGGNIEPQLCTPISTTSIPADKLVLSPHIYGPSLASQPYYEVATFPNNLPAVWDLQIGRFAKSGLTIVPGEWGALYESEEDKQTLDTLVQYFIDTHICSSFYWAWNPNSNDIGGVLLDDWQSVDKKKHTFLQKMWSECKTP